MQQKIFSPRADTLARRVSKTATPGQTKSILDLHSQHSLTAGQNMYIIIKITAYDSHTEEAEPLRIQK